jgi:hypothetical protein
MTRRMPFAAVVVAWGTAGCSLWLSFNPSGQPCDAQGQCLAGYVCVQGKCESVDAGPPSCQNTKCPVGSYCALQGGNLVCAAVPAGSTGALCIPSVAATCGNGLTCWQAAAPAPDGGAQGVCVSGCGGGCAQGQTCQAFSLALDAGTLSLCLPQDLLWSCASDSDCAGSGLVCTVFDAPGLGAATICASPVPGGAAAGQTCDGGGCADGLCWVGSCRQTCNVDTCPGGQSCALAEYAGPGGTRFVAICQSAATYCQACGVTVTCGADAPECTLLPSGLESACLADCASAGAGVQCPPGTTCDTGSNRCFPSSGACP